MKRLMLGCMAALLTVCLAGCIRGGQGGVTGGQELLAPADVSLSDGGETPPPDSSAQAEVLYLELIGGPFPLEEETVPYAIVNHSGAPVSVLLIPRLEREEDGGWTVLTPVNVGFCGVPDSVELRREGELPLSWYDGALAAGRYRLSFSLVDGEDYRALDELSAEFELTENERNHPATGQT